MIVKLVKVKLILKNERNGKMKKKLILVILGLVLLIPTSASAKETDKFVNRFDVEISKEEYETLKKMGYSDEIINGIKIRIL